MEWHTVIQGNATEEFQLSSKRGKFKLHWQDAPKRGKDFAFIAAIGVIVIATIVMLTINLLDQSQRHVEGIRQIHMEGPEGSRIEERATEADLTVKAQVEKDLNATKIFFDHHELTDRGLEHVARIKNLGDLSLAYTKVSDRGVKYLTKLPLYALNLCATDVTDEGLKEIAQIKGLHYLNLCETNITDRGIEALRPLKELNDLHLAATNITDRSMNELVNYHQPLWKLILVNTNITDAGLKTISNLENLEFLALDGTSVSAVGLKALGRNKKLRTLGLLNCEITDDDVACIVSVCPALELLDLSRTRITERSLAHICRLKSLRTLVLNRDHSLSAKSLEAFRKKMPACNVRITML
jgi:cell division protein ZapA (FtsZ GTPase activity inhibitor)